MHRVYPPVGSGNGLSEGQSNDRQPLDGLAETGVLERELQHAQERISLLEGERQREREQLQERIDDLQSRLDRSEEERREKDRQFTALLTDQRQPKRRRWWLRRKDDAVPS
jgi:chromosome segregation ATPase